MEVNKYTIPCPKCAHTRKKQGTKTCSVLEFNSGLSYKCFHCGHQEFVHSKKVDESYGESETVNTNFIEIPEGLYPFEDSETIFHKYYHEGKLMMYIARRGTGKDKWFRQITLSDDGWVMKPFDKAMLYKSEALDKDIVLVVEGEKAADAAQKRFKNISVVSWWGGSNNVGKGDWSLLNGKKVYLWPDNDDAGRKAMLDVSTRLTASEVYMVDTSSLPEKYDLADDIDADIVKKLINEAKLLEVDFLEGEMKADDIFKVHSEDFKYIPFGWENVDRYVQIPPSGVVIVSGRVNHGKTLMMINMALNVAAKTDKVVLYLSLEFPIMELNLRMVKALDGRKFSESGHEDDLIYNKMIREMSSDAAKQYYDLLRTRKLRVADNNVSPKQVLGLMDKVKAAGKDLVIFVDYLQVLPVDNDKGSYNKARYEKLKDMIEAMRFKANINKQVIVGGSQLTAGETPFTDSVRESKDLENTAALHIKIWNKAKARDKNITVSVGKEKKELYEEVPGDLVMVVEKARQNGANGRVFGFNSTNGCNLLPAVHISDHF